MAGDVLRVASATALTSSDRREQAIRDRSLGVGLVEPGPGREKSTSVREVVVRDLPLRSGHEACDRVAHRQLPVLRARCARALDRFGRPETLADLRLRPCGLPRGGFDVGAGDDAAGPAALDRVEVDAEVPGEAPQDRRVQFVPLMARAARGIGGGSGTGGGSGLGGGTGSGTGTGSGGGAGSGSGTGRGGCSAARRLRGASVASGVPTGTFSPSGTRIRSITPSSKISTSMSAFSVSTTATMSPRCTWSPGFTSHSVMVPASMSAPSDGMTELTHRRGSPAGRRRRSRRPAGARRPRDAWRRASAPRRCTRVRPGRRGRRRRAR